MFKISDKFLFHFIAVYCRVHFSSGHSVVLSTHIRVEFRGSRARVFTLWVLETSMLWHCWFGHMTCKIVPEMTYNVSSGTLSLYTTTLETSAEYCSVVGSIGTFDVRVLMLNSVCQLLIVGQGSACVCIWYWKSLTV